VRAEKDRIRFHSHHKFKKSVFQEKYRMNEAKLQPMFTEGENPRKIPKIIFIVRIIRIYIKILISQQQQQQQDDVAAFLKKNKLSIEIAFQFLNQLLQKYRFMEKHMQRNKLKFRQKVPEIEQTLNMVKFLQKKQAGEDEDEDDDEDDEKTADGDQKAFTTHFPLADSVYGKASIKPVGTVNLWLGASVMLEYTYKEARSLLETNLKKAQDRLKDVNEDLLFLRDMITTSEVNIARMFNHDVVLRKKEKGEK